MGREGGRRREREKREKRERQNEREMREKLKAQSEESRNDYYPCLFLYFPPFIPCGSWGWKVKSRLKVGREM